MFPCREMGKCNYNHLEMSRVNVSHDYNDFPQLYVKSHDLEDFMGE